MMNKCGGSVFFTFPQLNKAHLLIAWGFTDSREIFI